MGTEIERKYLVDKDKWSHFDKGKGEVYRQGYILTDHAKTIRIRLAGNTGYITIKGTAVNTARPEYEYRIPEQDAKELLENFCVSKISKMRYKILYEGKLWEVDEFEGDNDGLIVAEIELKNELETFKLPGWISKEVTGDERYYNSNLSLNPYKNWAKE